MGYILVNAQKFSRVYNKTLNSNFETIARLRLATSDCFYTHPSSTSLSVREKRVSDGIHSSITASFSFGYKTNMADSEGRKWIRGNRLSTFSLLCQPYEFKYFLQICYLLLNYNDVKRCRHHARRRGLGSRKP